MARPEPSAHLRWLARALRELASRQRVDETLQLAVDLAVGLVPDVRHAHIAFTGKGGVVTSVASDTVAVEIDHAQAPVGSGPAILAAREEMLVLVQDLRSEERWPEFSTRALGFGVTAVASFQLFLGRHEHDRLGVLTLYAVKPHVFSDAAIALGEVFAALCSSVLACAIDKEGADAALATRDTIGQAKGILMERHKISADDAFAMLERVSQERNVKLRRVAHQLAETGTLA